MHINFFFQYFHDARHTENADPGSYIRTNIPRRTQERHKKKRKKNATKIQSCLVKLQDCNSQLYETKHVAACSWRVVEGTFRNFCNNHFMR